MLAELASAYAALGKRREAYRTLDQLKQPSAGVYVPPYNVAEAYAALGDTDRALESLAKAYQERSLDIQWAGVDPDLDSLRSDPRFQDLLRRAGFPP